jgi:putative transposase
MLASVFGVQKRPNLRLADAAPSLAPHSWIGSVRRELLDRQLIVGRRQLEHVLRVYVRHHNRRRPHRALDLRPPDTNCARSSVQADSNLHDLRVRRRDLLGGLIHEHELAATA